MNGRTFWFGVSCDVVREREGRRESTRYHQQIKINPQKKNAVGRKAMGGRGVDGGASKTTFVGAYSALKTNRACEAAGETEKSK